MGTEVFLSRCIRGGNIKCQFETLSNLYLNIRRPFCVLPRLVSEIPNLFAPRLMFLSNSNRAKLRDPVSNTGPPIARRQLILVDENVLIFLWEPRYLTRFIRGGDIKCHFETLSNFYLHTRRPMEGNKAHHVFK